MVFSRYFTNRYRRRTRSGHFGIVHLAGTPFFPSKGGFCSLFLVKKKFPPKFTKRSPRKISQNRAPAKSYSTQNTNRIYQPASASNLPIPAKLSIQMGCNSRVFTAVEWRREEGGGRRGTAVPSHIPHPNHAGRKNDFFFFSGPASSKLNGHLVLVTRNG